MTTKPAYKITVLCEFLHVALLSQPQTFTKLRHWRARHQVFNFFKSAAARGSKVSIVGIVTSTIRGLIPGGVYIFMFSNGSRSHPASVQRGAEHFSRRVTLATCLYLVPQLRENEAIPPLPLRLHCVDRGNFTFYNQ
jgi:hypothetical protein